MSGLELRGVEIRVGDFHMPPLSLRLRQGRYGMLVGHTGAGKSLLIRAIAGLQPLRGGSISLHGRDITRLPPHRRRIGYVPQHGALLPHLDVAGNIGFALDLLGWERRRIDSERQALAEKLGIAALLHRRCCSLSGGERQKVALARALIREPELLILDEPLSAVDEQRRHELCDLLRTVHDSTGLTSLHICHSRRETEHLADDIFRLQVGRLIQDGPAEALLHSWSNT